MIFFFLFISLYATTISALSRHRVARQKGVQSRFLFEAWVTRWVLLDPR